MLRDDDDVESYVPISRQLEHGGKQRIESADKKARKESKKLRELQKRVELQKDLQQAQKKSGAEVAKTKTREEEIKEEREGAQQKTSAEEMAKSEAQQEAKKQASPFEYQQDAG
jgi:hypothetical protein